jgi:hypothetical protein
MKWYRKQHLTKVKRKVSKAKAEAKSSQAREEVKAIIDAYKAQHGTYPTRGEAIKLSGRSAVVVERALGEAIASQATSVTPPKANKAQTRHIAAQLKILTKQLEDQFEERVRLTMLERNKDYLITLEQLQKEASEKSHLYDKILNNYNPIFTEEEYKIILICLHPDNSASKEKREIAFKAFSVMKLQLTGKK